MQTDTSTIDPVIDISQSTEQKLGLDAIYQKQTKGTKLDVKTMLVPRGNKLSFKSSLKERMIVLSVGSMVIRSQDQLQQCFKAPAHFFLPADQPAEIITLEDSVCYGIVSKEVDIVVLDEQATQIEHFFSEGIYARKMLMSAGTQIPTHKHVYDHLSILAQGRVRVAVGPVAKEYIAPAMIEIKKNIAHTITAVEDSVWFCVHASAATDVESLEFTAIVKD